MGTAIHSEMEAWYLQKKVPEIAATKRLLPLAPNPTHPDVHVERAFRLLLPVGAARGFKDLLVPRPEARLMPTPTEWDWSPERPAVFDWKSTGNLAYAKTETDLLTDPQAILYGAAARLAVARRVPDVAEVDLQWTYTSTKRAESKVVRIRQTLPILEDGLGEVIATATEMRKTFSEASALGEKGVDETPYDLRECEKYGGCAHREYCTAFQHYAVYGRALPDPNAVPDPNALDAEYEVVTVAVPKALRRKEASMSSTLARLRAAAKTPPQATPAPAAESAPPTTEGAEAVTKPSAEPPLPVPDTSGLDTPTPPGTAPINSPQAAPDAAPTDPVPEGSTVAEPPKVSRSRKGAAKSPDVVSRPVFEAGDLRATVSEAFRLASETEDYALASALAGVLVVLGSRRISRG